MSLKSDMTPTHFTVREGGEWISWPPRTKRGCVFAIKFSNDMILDPISGWREAPPPRSGLFRRWKKTARRLDTGR